MKKIMIALGAVAFAICANAAAVTWSSGALTKDSKGNAITAANTITAYVWEIGAADYATYSAMNAATLAKTIGTAYSSGSMPAGFTAAGSASNTYKKGQATANVTGTIEHAAGDVVYGIILYADNGNPGYYFANVGTETFESAQNVTIADLGVNFNGAGGGAATWTQAQAAPEPTSGLLLLLGMAALALKRKRA